MVAIETVTVQLGEKEYTVSEQPHARAKPWRERLFQEIKPLFDQLGQVNGVQFETPADLLRLWPLIELVMSDAIDGVVELLITFAPELEADREYIEQQATERQIYAAFLQVAKWADPFGMAAQFGPMVSPGRKVRGTSSK